MHSVQGTILNYCVPLILRLPTLPKRQSRQTIAKIVRFVAAHTLKKIVDYVYNNIHAITHDDARATSVTTLNHVQSITINGWDTRFMLVCWTYISFIFISRLCVRVQLLMPAL